jgi:transketolase
VNQLNYEVDRASELLSLDIREASLMLSFEAGAAHLGSALSCADIIAVLFNTFLRNYTPEMFGKDNDHFILSKGHAATALYGALAKKGFLKSEDMKSYSKKGSILEEHPNMHIPGVEAVTGSLGHGLPIAVGLALGEKIKNKGIITYVLMSDGECNEGTVWESVQFASAKKIQNLICFVDHNGLQATGPTSETLGEINLQKVFDSFNWYSETIDGHSHSQIRNAIEKCLKQNRPSAIICTTTKGKGVSFMESDNNWHYRSPDPKELEIALKEIKQV